MPYLGFKNVQFFEIMRTLRALRPLKALSRIDAIKVSDYIF